jgi:hypothetical protein
MTTIKSTTAGNLYPASGPKVREPSHRMGGVLKESCSNVVVTATQADTDNLIGCPVPSNARVSQVLLSYADATTGGAIDVGVWKRNSADDDWEAVDDDLFASAMVITDGPQWNKDITNESAEYTAAEQEKPLWEVLGLSADPCITYWIGSDITTTFADASTAGICFKARYVE